METRCSAAGRLLGPLCCGLFLFVLLLLEGSAVFQAYALDVEVRDDANVTCLYTKWLMNLSVTYESEHDEYKSTAVTFPEHVSYDGSSCGNETSGPVLSIEFGEGHSWSISFTKTLETYQGSISFTYNTNDTDLFPDAKRKGYITTSVNYPSRAVELDTVYTCSMDSFETDNVTQEFWNITLQAFLLDGSLSSKLTVCDKDANTMRAAPSPTTTTIITTTTNATGSNTTIVPNTTATTLPTSEPGVIPGVRTYSLTNGTTVCLLAVMGLQLNISGQPIMNINPNTTISSGSCGFTAAVLSLKDTKARIDFLFAVRNVTSERFYLKEVNITVFDSGNGTLFAGNGNLSYWDTSLGSSYMCRKKETLEVTPSYKMNIFNLRIQPFAVKEGRFAIAEDCNPDVDNFFVPLMVGAALAGLIILVLLAYFVGRRAPHAAGYEQL